MFFAFQTAKAYDVIKFAFNQSQVFKENDNEDFDLIDDCDYTTIIEVDFYKKELTINAASEVVVYKIRSVVPTTDALMIYCDKQGDEGYMLCVGKDYVAFRNHKIFYLFNRELNEINGD
jgi:hypothetical protein